MSDTIHSLLAAVGADLTFEIAKAAGLDIEQARADMARPEIQARLAQDVDDLTALQVSRTPTFFVNGRSLPSFGPDQLATLLAEGVAKAKRLASEAIGRARKSPESQSENLL